VRRSSFATRNEPAAFAGCICCGQGYGRLKVGRLSAVKYAAALPGASARELRMGSSMKTLNLVKGKQQFCFRYEVGQESKVLESLIEMVNRRELTFDWFDAAVLSHQLGQHLAKELKGYLPKKAA
jgi:hypothetical protein